MPAMSGPSILSALTITLTSQATARFASSAFTLMEYTMNPDSPLTLLGGLTPREFLRDYWQKKPLLVRQAVPGFKSLLTPDELAGLSLEEMIESRIVIQEGEIPWELRKGPFQEEDYRHLPETHWTLLVQAVDQFLPEVAELVKPFRFLPTWRFDDLMISYAAAGGNVGPHFDNYDVFLLQGLGHRRWKIGQMCDADSPLRDHPDLRVLADFQQSNEWVLEPGDMLYLPPRLAHYGIAEDDCMTYSIGFRAPSAAEILVHYTDYLSSFITDEERYNDADIQPATDDSNRIGLDVADRLKKLIRQYTEDDEKLTSWMGRFMTEPRYPELITGEEIDQDDLFAALKNDVILVRNPNVRLAWSNEPEPLRLFANGNHRVLPAHLQPLVKSICDADTLRWKELSAWSTDEDACCLLLELVRQGSLELSDE